MRAPGTLVVVGLAGIVLVASDARVAANPGAAKAPSRTPSVDVSTYKRELVVLSDDDGNLYAVRPRVPGREAGPLFIGDGKTFYLQRITGGGADGSRGTWSYSVWAPRVPGFDDAQLRFDDQKRYFVACGPNSRDVELRVVSPKERDRVLASAVWKPRVFDRRVHLLARDEDGIYYFVDRDRDENETAGTVPAVGDRRYQHGHRVFVGKKGAMKLMPMTNVVADTAGEIYTTKRGELRIITDENKAATWIRGKKRTPLKILDLDTNRYLIYRELGIYTFLGTVCEDL